MGLSHMDVYRSYCDAGSTRITRRSLTLVYVGPLTIQVVYHLEEARGIAFCQTRGRIG